MAVEELGVVESEWRVPRHWQAAYQQNAARSSDKHGLVCASQASEVSQSIKEVKLFGPKHLNPSFCTQRYTPRLVFQLKTY